MESNPPKPHAENEEALLRKLFRERVGSDFMILEEVRGVHLVSQLPVRADLLCFAQPRILEMGFPEGWFVIEAKHLDFARHDSKRLYESSWQAFSYCHSEFAVSGERIRPAFAALLTNEQPDQRDSPVFQAQKRRWQILMEFGVYANVGFFRLEQSGDWELRFGQACLFHSRRGLNKVPRGLARYVGSRSTSI